MDLSESVARQIAEVALSLQSETGSQDTMDMAVKLAVEVLDDADGAAISLVHRGQITDTPAFTSDAGFRLNQMQQETGGGPCFELGDQEVVSCPDLAAEARWGDWGPRASSEPGIGSLLCFRLFTHEERIGALTVYSTQPHAFTSADIDGGASLAAHTAIAIAVARHDEHKDTALDSRALIGQAIGIIMDRYDLDAVRAFAVLRRLSQTGNVKLNQVAAELIKTRRLPNPQSTEKPLRPEQSAPHSV